MSLIQMSIYGGIMILIMVIIRALLLHRLPKRIFLLMWGAILVRLLVPYLLPCTFSVYSILSNGNSTDKISKNISVPFVTNYSTDVIFDGDLAVDFWMVIWLIGTCSCFIYFMMSYLKCIKQFNESLPVDNSITRKWIAEHKIFRTISIRFSDRISTPLTYGVFHPVILIPKKLRTDDLKYILAHEYVHIRRFDVVYKIVLAAALCVHWFNPTVWLMYIIANMDIELSCDNDVLCMLGNDEKQAYAMSLIRMEESRNSMTPLINHFGKKPIKERIVAIMNFKKATSLAVAVGVCLLVGTITVFATTAETNDSDLVQQINKFEGTTTENTNTFDSSISKDDVVIPNDTITAGNEVNSLKDDFFSVERITLEPGMEIPVPADGNYIIHDDIDENGNRIVQYTPIESEPASPAQTKGYTHEEILEDGILRW